MAETSPVIQVDRGVTVVAFAREGETLDEGTLDRLRDKLLEVAMKAAPPLLVLDMSTITFFSSSFIELLFRMSKRMQEQNGKFALCGLQKYCAEVLSITRVDKLLAIYPSQKEALAALTQK